MLPELTIAIPTYNRRHGLGAVVDCVATQLRAGDELILSDDASSDGTADAFRGHANLTVVCQPKNLGMVGNWNYCLTAGTKDWVCLLHDDDHLLPGALESIRRACGIATGPALVAHAEWGKAQRYDDGGFCLESREAGRFASLNAEFCPSGVTIHRAIPAMLGGFSFGFPYSADMEYFARVCARFPSFVILNPRVVEYIVGGANYQLRTWQKADFLEQLRVVEAASIGHAGLDAVDAEHLLRTRMERDLYHMIQMAHVHGDRVVVRRVAHALLKMGTPSLRRKLGWSLAATLGRAPGRLIV